jgi:hypothetical protein
MTLVCARNLCEGCFCLDEQALGLAPLPQQVRQFLVLALDESLQAQGEKAREKLLCECQCDAQYAQMHGHAHVADLQLLLPRVAARSDLVVLEGGAEALETLREHHTLKLIQLAQFNAGITAPAAEELSVF